LFNASAIRTLGLKESDFGKKIPGGGSLGLKNFKKVIRIGEYEIKEPSEIEGYKRGGEELHIKNREGEQVFKIITRKVYGKNNNYHGILKIFNDVTREESMNKLKSEFISVAAHQLRTPLSAIKWILKMILDEDAGELKKEQEEFMEKGYESTERVIGLVENLLYVSRIEEGRFGYDFVEFDFEEVVGGSMEKVKDGIDKKDLKFKMDRPAKLPIIYGDPQKLEMALYYIMDNAVKYTPQNGTVSLTIKKKDRGKQLEVKVKDNGVGIPEDGLDKLFSKFYRAANVLRMETEGNGLGLFIIRSIIKEHGGEVVIKSEEAKGTEVSFTIPIKKEKSKKGKKGRVEKQKGGK
jgi:signal transduction histidine kinase